MEILFIPSEKLTTRTSCDIVRGLEVANLISVVDKAIESYVQENKKATTSELHIAVFQNLIPALVQVVNSDGDIEAIGNLLSTNNLDVFIKKHLVFDTKSGYWKKP